MAQDIKDKMDTEERAKGPFARFFISGWTNIVRMMGVNVLFLLFNIPSFLVAFLYAVVFMPGLINAFDLHKFISVPSYQGMITPVQTNIVSYQLLSLLFVFFIFSIVASLLICIGPFQAGFAQVYKDIRNGTSVSLIGSFKAGLKANWKKSLVPMFIGFILSAVIILAVSFYFNMDTGAGIVIGTVFCVLYFAFILVQNFVYNLMVSTDLKLGKLYKNAILFLFIKFVPCLGLALAVMLVYIVIPFVLLMSASYLTLGIFVFFYSFLAVSWSQYLLSYYAGYLIDRYVAEDKKDNEGNIEDNDELSGDNGLELERKTEGTQEENTDTED